MAKKTVYIVYNRWQDDYETWGVYLEKAFLSRRKAEDYAAELEKASRDRADSFQVEEVEFEE